MPSPVVAHPWARLSSTVARRDGDPALDAKRPPASLTRRGAWPEVRLLLALRVLRWSRAYEAPEPDGCTGR